MDGEPVRLAGAALNTDGAARHGLRVLRHPPTRKVNRSGDRHRLESERHQAPQLLAATTGIRYYPLCAIRMGQWQSRENLRKHGVDFADAIAALENTSRLEEIDTRVRVRRAEQDQVIGVARDEVLCIDLLVDFHLPAAIPFAAPISAAI